MTIRARTAPRLALFSLFVIALAAPARADLCRDARGEPIACVPPPSEPAPEALPDRSPRERETGYVDLALGVDFVDPSGARFTPDAPSSVPEVERGSHLEGLGSSFEHVMAGLVIGGGYRPVPWLRLPDARFSFGYGDFGGMGVDVVGGGPSLTASLHDVWMVRLQVGGGFDVDFDPVRLFALAHVGVSGYFVQADVGGSSIGGLGSDTFSALSLDLGWTLGMEIALDHEIAYTLGYRHVHTGVEQNAFFVGLDVRIE